MDLNLYFEPVELDRPEHALPSSKAMFGQNIRIHTPSMPIDEISNYRVALFGVCEDRDSLNRGTGDAPDSIRAALYQLFRVHERLRIIDLGNLKSPASVQDTCFGLRDVMLELLGNQLVVVMMGGSQDLTWGAYMAYEQLRKDVRLVSVDARMDTNGSGEAVAVWMEKIMKSAALFQYTHLGHQQYLNDRDLFRDLDDRLFESVRLGILRSNLAASEPVIRDADLLSFDMAAIRQSDSPGTMFPSPNGLIAEEACQLARYAGLSERVSCFGLFECNPVFDRNRQSAHLAAQMIWYFIEGLAQRREEIPAGNHPDFKVFVVSHQDMEHELTFYKSLVTNRWWMEVPVVSTGESTRISCTVDEYEQACRHEIPDLWWKVFQRIN